MEFIHDRFGYCQIISYFNDVAVVKVENNFEKYVVTMGLSIKDKCWKSGIYCKDLQHAMDIFYSLL